MTDSSEAQEAAKPKSLKERAGYALGVVIGTNVKKSGMDVDTDQFAKAIVAVLKGEKLALTDEEIQQTMKEAQDAATAKQSEAGTKWLAENGKKEGVKTTESGLQYQVLKEGDGGAKPNIEISRQRAAAMGLPGPTPGLRTVNRLGRASDQVRRRPGRQLQGRRQCRRRSCDGAFAFASPGRARN